MTEYHVYQQFGARGWKPKRTDMCYINYNVTKRFIQGPIYYDIASSQSTMSSKNINHEFMTSSL